MTDSTNPYAPPVDPGDSPPPLGATTTYGPFLDASGRGKAAMVFLGIAGGSQLLRLVWDAHYMANYAEFSQFLNSESAAEPSLAFSVYALLGLLFGLVWFTGLIGSAIAFCMWFYRVYGNLPALGIPRMHSQGLAPGGFFIPFANLYYPYAIATEIWKGSVPEHDVSRWRGSPVGPWWGTYIGGSVLGIIAEKLEQVGPSHLVLDMVSAVLVGLGAIFAIQVIRGIQWRQTTRFKELEQNPQCPT